jgi:hypothetical protein
LAAPPRLREEHPVVAAILPRVDWIAAAIIAIEILAGVHFH